ncbi:MAG: TlpA disulfide reductase family protein [Bacteroidales bacterium]|jgi:thiol-disulfide isomerase/thioredoxin|nr:TlpA disulfide reductase family protein [Bacteroidales bacterium]
MLRIIRILILLLASVNTMAQEKSPAVQNDDPFIKMVRATNALNTFIFTSQLNMKQVFTFDTIRNTAEIRIKKSGVMIQFLQIIPSENQKELLFCLDSAWVVDHSARNMALIGHTHDDLSHNFISTSYPFTLFTLDTMLAYVSPFWKITGENNDFYEVTMDIANKSEDVSDVLVKFMIRKPDFLPYGLYQESVYLKVDKMFQEQILSDFRLLDTNEIEIPGYYYLYERSGLQENSPEMDSAIVADPDKSTVYLSDLELFTLEGDEFKMYGDGLVLLDLWYVGCAPCMKSAPVVEKLYKQYGSKVHFLSINEVDRDSARIKLFKEKMGITVPALLGGENKIANRFSQYGGYPVFILFEASTGKVLWHIAGYSEELEKVIGEVIEKNL